MDRRAGPDTPDGNATHGTTLASRRILWSALGAGAALALAACYGVATRTLVLGSVEGGWHYPYIRELTSRPIGATLLVAGIAATLLALPRASRGRREWLLVLAWLAAATVSQGLIRSLTPVSFERIFLSPGAHAFYSVTQDVDARTLLRDFEAVRARAPLHAQSNMPGKMILLYALEAISERPGVLVWLVVLLSNLGGVLMYIFVRDLFHDARTALYSLVLYLFVPAKLLFFPLMNTVTPVLILACTCALLRWLQTGRTAYAALAGVGVYALVFFEPLPLVLGLLFAALIARALVLDHITWRQLIPQLAAGAAACAAAHAVVYLAFGFDTLHVFRQVGAHAVEFNALANRPYAVWVIANLREFAFGAGVCQAVLFLGVLISALSAAGDWRKRLTQPIAVLCLSLVAVLAATDLAGVNRGEVIRLWIFLACFLQIPAAYACARLDSRPALLLIVVLSALQAALGTALIGFIVV